MINAMSRGTPMPTPMPMPSFAASSRLPELGLEDDKGVEALEMGSTLERKELVLDRAEDRLVVRVLGALTELVDPSVCDIDVRRAPVVGTGVEVGRGAATLSTTATSFQMLVQNAR